MHYQIIIATCYIWILAVSIAEVVEQKLLILPEHLSSLPVFSGVRKWSTMNILLTSSKLTTKRYCPFFYSPCFYYHQYSNTLWVKRTCREYCFFIVEHLSSLPVFSGVRVTRSLVLYVCFVDRFLSFWTFSFGHCFVCSSSIYGFWLPL
jgi:hypothetical protein